MHLSGFCRADETIEIDVLGGRELVERAFSEVGPDVDEVVLDVAAERLGAGRMFSSSMSAARISWPWPSADLALSALIGSSVVGTRYRACAAHFEWTFSSSMLPDRAAASMASRRSATFCGSRVVCAGSPAAGGKTWTSAMAITTSRSRRGLRINGNRRSLPQATSLWRCLRDIRIAVGRPLTH